MQFIIQTLLLLLMFFAALSVFLKGSKGAALAALFIVALTIVRGGKVLPIVLAAIILVVTIILELLSRRSSHKGRQGFLTGLVGSLVSFLLFGIFFGPIGSLVIWLLTTGLKLFPQLREHPYWFAQWAPTLVRSGLSLSVLAVGVYTVYAG